MNSRATIISNIFIKNEKTSSEEKQSIIPPHVVTSHGNENLKKFVWDQYTQAQLNGEASDQTKLFFCGIPKPIQNSFISSTSRLLQLGVASGQYLAVSGIPKRRQCIGYDFSETAIERSKANGIDAKLVNLCSMNETGELTYLSQLDDDLSEQADLLAIRVFECLDPEAVVLLVFALIDKAKPNSIFYIETYLDEYSEPDLISHKIKHGYIASFFGPRTDIKFCHHSVNLEVLDTGNDSTKMNNRLVVQKL